MAQHLRESLEQLQVPAGLIEECIANIAPAASVFPEPGGAPVPGPEPVPAEGTPAAVSWRVSEILRFFPSPPPPLFFVRGSGAGFLKAGRGNKKKAYSFGTHLSLALLLRNTGAREAEGKRERCRCRCRGVLRRCGRGRRAATGPRRRLKPRARPFFSCSTLPSSPPPLIDSLGRFSRSPPCLPRPPVPSPPRPPRTKYSSSPASLLSLIKESTIVEARLKQRESCLSKLNFKKLRIITPPPSFFPLFPESLFTATITVYTTTLFTTRPLHCP